MIAFATLALTVICSWMMIDTQSSAVTTSRARPMTISTNQTSTIAMGWEEWSLEELERQMSPSRWNPNKTANEVIQQYINVTLEGTKKAKETIPCQLDVAYGTASAQKYDLYGTDLPSNSPIFFFIHGGYWQEGSKDLAGAFSVLNRKNGVRTVAFGYTLAPEAKIEQIQSEVVAALKKITTDYPNAKMIVSGHSAGGQLAAHLLYYSKEESLTQFTKRIAGLVLFSGVYDLRPLVKTYINTHLKMTLEEAVRLSALLKPGPNPNAFDLQNLKIFVVVGGHDSPEFQRQTSSYYEHLKENVPQTSSWTSPDDDHFTLIENLANETTAVAKEVQAFLLNFKL